MLFTLRYCNCFNSFKRYMCFVVVDAAAVVISFNISLSFFECTSSFLLDFCHHLLLPQSLKCRLFSSHNCCLHIFYPVPHHHSWKVMNSFFFALLLPRTLGIIVKSFSQYINIYKKTFIWRENSTRNRTNERINEKRGKKICRNVRRNAIYFSTQQ